MCGTDSCKWQCHVTSCVVQKVQSTSVVAIVEAIAASQAATPAFSGCSSRDVPAFVPKTVQQQLLAVARKLLQAYVLRHAEPLIATVTAAFSDTRWTQLDTADIGPARPCCAEVAEQLTNVAVEAACLLPAGESLPPGLVR